ncbi:MAG: hypothetical protein SPL36_06775, partial [Succiniclasticum sp.]|nr:hypothetical protein [Succiniclasticum sp.]
MAAGKTASRLDERLKGRGSASHGYLLCLQCGKSLPSLVRMALPTCSQIMLDGLAIRIDDFQEKRHRNRRDFGVFVFLHILDGDEAAGQGNLPRPGDFQD